MTMNDFRKSRAMPFVKQGMRVLHTYNGKKDEFLVQIEAQI